MRIFIDVTDLRRRTRDKYDRIVRKLAAETAAVGGRAVELRDGGAQIVVAPPIASETTPKNWRTTRWRTSLGAESAKRIVKLAAKLGAGRVLGRAPAPAEKDQLAWDLAYSLEAVPLQLRARLADFLELRTDAARMEKFHYWLSERTESGKLVEVVEAMEAPTETLERGDLLILAGASWGHADIRALEALKRQTGIKLAFYVNDLLPIDFPSIVTARQRAWFKAFMLGAGRIGDAVFAPNAASLARIDALFLHHGIRHARLAAIDVRSAALAPGPSVKPPGIADIADAPFALCPSSLRERKHLMWLYAVYARLRATAGGLPRLLFAGRPDDLRVLRILTSDPNWSETAHFLANPSDVEMRWLYENALLCLYPSFEGGLGMPIMEAERFARPCLAADNPALVAAGEPDTLFLPKDETIWSRAICDALKGPRSPAPQPRPAPALLAQILSAVDQ